VTAPVIDAATDGNGRRLYLFWCPGCDCYHGPDEGWTFNGDVYKPTIRPSVLSTGTERCHLYVTNGRIQYLGDCSHAMAGKTIDMEPVR